MAARQGDTILLASLVLLVAGLFVASLAIGPVWLPPASVAAALIGRANAAANIIVVDIRLPRALLALLIGGTLGLSGAALQGLLRNPLAAPSLFGAPAAAAFGAVSVISLGLVDALSFALPIAALAGALSPSGFSSSSPVRARACSSSSLPASPFPALPAPAPRSPSTSRPIPSRRSRSPSGSSARSRIEAFAMC